MYKEFSKKYRNILITGGYGFIGSCLLRNLLKNTDCNIINIDKLNYASNQKSILSILENYKKLMRERYHFEKIDLNNNSKLKRIFNFYKPEIVFHLAAETHVDKSIASPEIFIKSNILGTFNLLEVAKNYWEILENEKKRNFLLIHVSTDEVFGSLGKEGLFSEKSPYSPNSPYSASKAGSDHLVRAWHSTYNFPAIITNCSNNYGPWQYPEKLIPVIINNALDRKKIPIYGKGNNIRDWLHVEDHIRALIIAALRGKAGDNYCIGGGEEKTNLEIANIICEELDLHYPTKSPHKELINFTEDRLGHDYRYCIDNSLIKKELGWSPKYKFKDGIIQTINWYINNKIN